MEEIDKNIMSSLNEFVLYCKNFYKRSDDILEDISNLLKPTYLCTKKEDVIPIIIGKWSEWNEKLPVNVKLDVASFWRKINHNRTFLYKEKDFNELALIVIYNHIRFIDAKYLNIMPPLYKKGKIRYGLDHQGMTYKEMNYLSNEYFKKG